MQRWPSISTFRTDAANDEALRAVARRARAEVGLAAHDLSAEDARCTVGAAGRHREASALGLHVGVRPDDAPDVDLDVIAAAPVLGFDENIQRARGDLGQLNIASEDDAVLRAIRAAMERSGSEAIGGAAKHLVMSVSELLAEVRTWERSALLDYYRVVFDELRQLLREGQRVGKVTSARGALLLADPPSGNSE